MVLRDTFPTTTQQKVTLATLAFQAEYSGSADSEQVQRNFIVEHYASKDLVNKVGRPSVKVATSSIAFFR